MLSRFPYPLEKGDKLRAYHQLRYLSEKYRVILCCTIEERVSEAAYNEISKYCAEIHLFPLRRAGLLFQGLLTLFSGKPFQVAYFYRYRIHRKIERLLRSTAPDHIFCQLVRVADYVKDYHSCSKTLDYMDALSKGMERRIEKEPFYRRWFFRAEFHRLSRYERNVFDYFEQKVIISTQDRQYILHPDRAKIAVIPNGVDERFFDAPELEKTADLLFTGNFSYPPNVEAACFLAEQLLPALHRRGHHLKLMLSGANPSPKVKALSSKNVVVTGWVDDIRMSYASARIFVAPMFIGTGLQNKLLEAMASGLPCITTPLANNALGGADRENILLAEQNEEFVEKVELLLTNKIIFTLLSDNGKQFVQGNYSWVTQNDQLLFLMRHG